jgi:CRP-like cAMP-binding protein
MHDFPDAIEELCTYAKVQFQEPRSPIFSVGVQSDFFYFLIDGSVEIYDVTAKSQAEDTNPIDADFLHDVTRAGEHPMSPKSIARVLGIENETASSLLSTFDLTKLYTRSGTASGDDGRENILRPSNKIRMAEVWDQIWEKAKAAASNQDYLVELPEIREVEAPAFMGESVLWNDESEAIRQYTATCKTECELVLSRKAHIDAVLKKNPLLYERYHAFRWYVRLYTYHHGLPVNCAEFIRKIASSRKSTRRA